MTNFKSENGNALIIVLWLLAILAALTSAFAMNAIIQTQITEAIAKMGSGYSLARAGLEAWMAQVRADAVDRLADVGVVGTEVMFYYPKNPVRINEVDHDLEQVEIYNASEDISVNINNWVVEDAAGNVGTPASGSLGPGEFKILTSSGLSSSTYTEDTVVLKNSEGVVMDKFGYELDGATAGTFQVLPDGWNGIKPALNYSTEPGWIRSTNKTMGSSNAKGMWVKVDDGDTAGIKLEQYNEDGDLVNTFNFGTDITEDITPEKYFLQLESDSARLVVTRNLAGDSITEYYSNGKNDNDSSVQVINSGGAFPNFNDTNLITKVYVPKPEFGNVQWEEYAYSDSIAKPADATLMDGHSEGKHYVARLDTEPASIRRGDSVIASPDPGGMRPAAYTGSKSDYLFHTGSGLDGKMYVSELIDTMVLKGSEIDHLLITKLNIAEDEWYEIFNPSSDTLTLDLIEQNDRGAVCDVDADIGSDAEIPPGGYLIVAEDGGPVGANDKSYDYSIGVDCDPGGWDNLLEHDHDAVRITTKENGDTDVLGWDGDNYSSPSPNLPSDMYETNVGPEEHGSVRMYRKTNATGNPIETNDNGNDFEDDSSDFDAGTGYSVATTVNDPKNEFVELLLYGAPSIDFPEQNEFIEIYNTGSDVDITKSGEGFTIEDTLNKYGVAVSGSEYDIVMHPEATTSDGTLNNEQIGLILSEDADTSVLGSVSSKVEDGLVKLYTLENSSDEKQFLTGGLHNEQKEHIFLRRGTASDRRILDSGESWLPDAEVAPMISMEKQDLDGDNKADNWDESDTGGTPGEVPALGKDDFTECWGWGGEFFGDGSGVHLGDTVYLPSESTTYTDGDYGYFKIVDIQDEAGKQNLVTPPTKKALDTEDEPAARSLTSTQSTQVMNRADSQWLTGGDMMYISDLGVKRVMNPDSGRINVYSVYREGMDSKAININTASYESLRGIQMNSDTTADPAAFLTDDMARAIIEQRSGLTGTAVMENLSDILALEKTEQDQYASGSGASPFSAEKTACSLLEDGSDNFECTTFKQYSKVNSDGIFRARVVGVPLTSEGKKGVQVRLEAVVDRSELVEYDTGTLKILYMRKY